MRDSDAMRVAFWKRRGAAPRFRDEPEELSTLVLAKLRQSITGPVDLFVKHRFWRPFEHSVNSAFKYSGWFTFLTVVVIAGGVASSLLSQTEWSNANTLIAITGILVGIAAAVNRLWRPGLRGALRHQAANELRREGWRFVCDEGQYKDLNGDRIGTFFKEVERINAPAEAIDETPGDES